MIDLILIKISSFSREPVFNALCFRFFFFMVFEDEGMYSKVHFDTFWVFTYPLRTTVVKEKNAYTASLWEGGETV